MAEGGCFLASFVSALYPSTVSFPELLLNNLIPFYNSSHDPSDHINKDPQILFRRSFANVDGREDVRIRKWTRTVAYCSTSNQKQVNLSSFDYIFNSIASHALLVKLRVQSLKAFTFSLIKSENEHSQLPSEIWIADYIVFTGINCKYLIMTAHV